MKTNKRKSAVLTLAIMTSFFAVNSYAASVALVGSSTIGSIGATITGTDLSNPGLITIILPFYGTNNGDFSPIPTFESLNVGVLDLSNMATFDILGLASSFNLVSPSLPAVQTGSYDVTSLTIIGQSADFLQIETTGIIIPSSIEGTEPGGCATNGNTCANTLAKLRLSFSESGLGAIGSISASGTFNTMTTAVPEPSMISLILAGLATLKVTGRKLFNSSAA